MKRLMVLAVIGVVAVSAVQVWAFESEKDTKDFIAKNVNVITDFNRTKGAIAAIPTKIVVAGINTRYVLVPYRGPTIGGGILGGLVGAVITGATFDDMKKQAVEFPSLVVQSFQRSFRPAKLIVLPLEAASSASSYQALDTKTFPGEMKSQGAGFALPPAWEYLNYDLWKLPAPGLRFLAGGDLPKKVFPALRTELGVDGVALVQVTIMKFSDETIKIGDCIIDIYAPAKSPNNPDVLAFSVNIKGPGEPSRVIAVKKDQWKVKEKDKVMSKPISDYWPLIGKWLEDFFSSYTYIADQSIK